jgi:RNA polymerase sigma-70 factor (ECF subfamily)
MDDAELARLYRTHVEFVWRLSRSLGVALVSVDDVVHEVFLVIGRTSGARDGEVALRAWIAGIVRNVVMHHHRSRVREARRHLQVVPPEPPPTPDDDLGRAEAAAQVMAFLDSLDPSRREVFALMELEGLSAPEVAAMTGTKLPTVYTRLRAARIAFAAFVDRLRDDGAAAGTHRGARHVRR